MNEHAVHRPASTDERGEEQTKPRSYLRSRLICPVCGAALGDAMWSSERVICSVCTTAYPRYLETVVDLRLRAHSSCWTETLTIDEAELCGRLLEASRARGLAGIIASYGAAHARLPNDAGDDVQYMSDAARREGWTVKFMLDALRRYTSARPGGTALDAGSGSGGALVHLARLHGEVAGVDPDLPALLVAAVRCREAEVADRVLLVAAPLEERVFMPGTFDLVKCTDVIEHVNDPVIASAEMASATREGGMIYVLTPNKWNFYSREPHVQLWGVQFLPRRLADAYCRRRLGVTYSTVTHLLSSRQLRETLEQASRSDVKFVAVEDKYLNPDSRRGQRLKRVLAARPFRWFSRAALPVQPVLIALTQVRRVESR